MKRETAACLLAFFTALAPGDASDAADPNDSWPSSLETLRAPVERSVARGVAWLAATQNPDGTVVGRWGNNTGIVGLCGKALVSAGITPDHPVYGSNLVRYAEFILNAQRADGLLWLDAADSFGGSAYMYAHSISTAFLSECSGMADARLQQRIDAALPKSIAVILGAQRGGWRYSPTPPQDCDLSVTAWSLLALRGARRNGAPVPRAAIERAVAYVYSSRFGDGRFGYLVKRGPWGPTVQMTGCGLLCLMLTGHHDDPVNRLSADVLLNAARPDGWIEPTTFWNMPGHREYTLYHGTLALFQMGGDHWERYVQRVFPGIIARQGADGSWNGDISASYSTAMHLLALTAPYEQAPMNQR